MKRTLATLISLGSLLAYSTPAYALYKPHAQPRLALRMQKRATLASYLGRHNQAYRLARYNELIRTMLPSLAVTGPGKESDASSFSRPNSRYLDNLALHKLYENHCAIHGKCQGNDQ